MKPSELFTLPVQRTTNDLLCICSSFGHSQGNFLPEIIPDWIDTPELISDRAEVRFLKDWNFDGRRVWILATVWLDENPVMILQSAGREGRDHSKRFIVDEVQFIELCEHVQSMLPIAYDGNDLTGFHDEMGDVLTDFYGYKLGGMFKQYI